VASTGAENGVKDRSAYPAGSNAGVLPDPTAFARQAAGTGGPMIATLSRSARRALRLLLIARIGGGGPPVTNAAPVA